MKPVLITGGSDWTDASADLIEVPDDLNMTIAHIDYQNWLRTLTDRKGEYLMFRDWLKSHRGAIDSKIETFEE